MNEARKCAYRHLGLTGYTSVINLISPVKVSMVNFGNNNHNKRIEVVIDISSWLELLMNGNVDNFINFNEDEFWNKHSELCQKHQGYGFEVCREVFDDSYNHASKSSQVIN